jgi:diguanylate cyclase (GGDEF)-like protein
MGLFDRFLSKTAGFQSLQQQIIMLACTVVLSISLSVTLVYEYFSYNRDSTVRLATLADIIAEDLTAALAFEDYQAIQNSLQSLKADPNIRQLMVLNLQEVPVAFYIQGAGQHSVDDLNTRITGLQQRLSDPLPLHGLVVKRPIQHLDTTVGAILLEQNSSLLVSKLLISGGMGIIILLLSILGSYLLARRLSRIVTDPVLSLSATIEEVSRTKVYRLRAAVYGIPELSQLAAGFNGMLDEIAQRDETLLERQERLHRLANFDTLTGLPNRRLFADRLEQALQRAGRSNEKLAVLFIDLDDFKLINDTHGHRVGDLLLHETAQRLEKETRAGDTLARMGGDEFTVFLQNIEEPDNALQIANKQLQNLLNPYLLEDKQLFISASIGIAFFPDHGTSAEVLIKSADTAMYQAKKKGKNNCGLFTQDLYNLVSKRLSLQGDLRRALEQQEFVLHYQPRINLQTGNWSGVEALVRWNHPRHGLLAPASFISLAEDTGLIMQLGEWVLVEACRQLHRWHQEGVLLPRISINVSPLQFHRQDIVQLVKDAVRASLLCTQALELEITESALMEDQEQSIKILQQLQQLGVNISIDDFGTGYSSLSQLRSLPINILKIDRSFVLHVHESEEDAQILSAIFAMAHSLQLETVAEGVECGDQERLLKQLGCLEAQGYHYAHPMPADELTALLRTQPSSLEPIRYSTNINTPAVCCLLNGSQLPCGDNPGLICRLQPGRPAACYGRQPCQTNSAICNIQKIKNEPALPEKHRNTYKNSFSTDKRRCTAGTA